MLPEPLRFLLLVYYRLTKLAPDPARCDQLRGLEHEVRARPPQSALEDLA